mmetsp:Transcript_1949/g.3827  ORF Transcript_1949/g.3827 Transcript_1949/m.3827 type:complete len:339 (+) Transcript_1949:332-1348(+)
MEKIEGNRNFANKLWNAGRYLVQMIDNANLSPQQAAGLAVSGPIEQKDLDNLPLAERYIVSRAHETIEGVTSALHAHNIAEAGSLVYDFFWNQYTNWYIEASKVHASREGATDESKETVLRTLVYVFDASLRMLHPFMPYVTETLWQRLPHHGESLMIADWPKLSQASALARSAAAEKDFGILQEVVNAVRSARAEYKVEPGKKVGASIMVKDPDMLSALNQEKDVLAFIARIDPGNYELINAADYVASEAKTVKLVIREGLEVELPLSQMVDAEKEKQRLSKQAEKMQKDIDLLDKRLSSKGFVDKAPPAKVEETRGQREEKAAQLAKVMQAIADLA